MGSMLNTLLSISLIVCIMDKWSAWGPCEYDDKMDDGTCIKTRHRDVKRKGSDGGDNSCAYQEEEEYCECGNLSQMII